MNASFSVSCFLISSATQPLNFVVETVSDLNSLIYVAAAIVVAGVFFAFMRTRKVVRENRKLDKACREAELACHAAESAARERVAEAEKAVAECRAESERAARENLERERDLELRAAKLDLREQALTEEREKLVAARERYEEKIRDVAGISLEEARADILKSVAESAADEARRIRREILEKSEKDYADDARKLLITTMQRVAPRLNDEISSELVPIPAEEIKGRLIGREGRNIKSFEQLTGTTLIIDDTPGSVLVSCFDPFRRQVASLALRHLIDDGRIHPQSIEYYVEEAKQEASESALLVGTKACDDLGLLNVSEKVRELLGKLQFRLSINQNTLEHSIETAQLAGTFAAELGLNVGLATRAGLFHDIGKAVDANNEDAHAIAGARVLRQAGECREVVNAVESHHREVGHENIYGPLVMLADSISATRPGARASTHEGYAERIYNLEKIAKGFPGVTEAFAIQAGHEVRVMVSSSEVNDAEARAIARKIRIAIEENLTYPGKIRVVVIRELRIHEDAL